MFLTTILALITSLAITLTLASSPLLIGLWIIRLSLCLSLLISLFSSWLGIIVFLIYIGGLLVIFAYFVALTPNLLIEGQIILKWLLLTFLALIILSPFFFINTTKLFYSFWQAPLRNLIAHNFLALTILASILFFALVAVVKLCSSFSSPLRPFN